MAAVGGGALFLLAATSHARVIDGVVALVNDEPVTFSEVREAVSEGMGIPVGDADGFLREERDPRMVLRWIEGLVETVLVRKELERLGQPIPEKDIDKTVEGLRKANGMSEAQFAEALAKEGITLPAYRRKLRWQMERGAIVRAKRFKDVVVTEQEVRDYFGENTERFLSGGQVQGDVLFLPFPSPHPQGPGDPAATVRIAAQQAVESLREGRTFQEAYEAARSALPAAQLVQSGFVSTDDLLPEMQREVRRLRSGETSPPFFTEAGAYIVRVVARRGGKVADFSSVKDILTDELTDRRSEKAYADILAELKKTASIDVRL